MVNNSTNIIKTKESLNIKTKESLNNHGQQFHQFHQKKRQFKQPSLFRLSFVLMLLMKLLTITI
jgi:hypothetical protein